MSFILVIFVIAAVIRLGIGVIAKWDTPLRWKSEHVRWILVATLVEGLIIWQVFGEGNFFRMLLLGIFAGCLLLACITDAMLCQVYRFVWWMAIAVGGLLLLTDGGQSSIPDNLVLAGGGLLLFGVLQYGVFGRTYGRADCHAFVSCALVETAMGAGMEVYLIHMILAYVLLAVVQIKRKNVSKWGELCRPVPFLPYINVSFWLVILMMA